LQRKVQVLGLDPPEPVAVRSERMAGPRCGIADVRGQRNRDEDSMTRFGLGI
jgi:hypothetical protein